jgi:hypothetical protein
VEYLGVMFGFVGYVFFFALEKMTGTGFARMGVLSCY